MVLETIVVVGVYFGHRYNKFHGKSKDGQYSGFTSSYQYHGLQYVRTIGGKKLSVFIDSMRIAKAKELGCKSILLKAEKPEFDKNKKRGIQLLKKSPYNFNPTSTPKPPKTLKIDNF